MRVLANGSGSKSALLYWPGVPESDVRAGQVAQRVGGKIEGKVGWQWSRN